MVPEKMGPIVHNGRVVILEFIGRVNQTLFGEIMQECYPTATRLAEKKEMKQKNVTHF